MSQPPFPPSLRQVLHVEDSPADAELIATLLKEEWPDCHIQRVFTREAFVAALEQDRFDIILSDFSLPRFDGPSALALARERARDIPFIFLSGTIGEDNAVDALRRGATDYVLKDRPARLVSAIRRALEEVRELQRRRRAEADLREHAELLDKAHDAIVVTDLERRIRYWNQGAERAFGWRSDEVVGRHAAELFGLAGLAQFDDARRNIVGDDWHGEIRLNHRDGRPLVLDSRVTVIRDAKSEVKSHLIISNDITEQRKLEQQFLRAQRLESIGVLAGGIAHDLNNVLAPVLIGVTLVRQKVRDPEVQRLMDVLEASVQRGAGLIRQVLAFARGTEGERVELQPKLIIREVITLLKETLPKSIAVRADLAPDLATIEADATQLSQVLMNLCVNARDAMPDGGELSIRARNVVKTDLPDEPPPADAPKTHVEIAVKDTGCGIPPEIIERIFDPFFTTKGAGKGTGLGLSTTLGIVKTHGGFIDVRSTLDKGTEFLLHFPVARQHSDQCKAPVEAQPPRGRGAMVLVIDDENAVRDSIAALLSSFGYVPITAADGTTGLALFRQRQKEIRAAIVDMMMPGIQGTEVLRQVRKLNPTIGLVAISGIAESLDHFPTDLVNVGQLRKPMSGPSILNALAEAIAQQEAGSTA